MRVKIEEVKSSQSNQNDVDFYKKWRLYAKTLLCTSITDIFRHILLRSVRQAPPPLFDPIHKCIPCLHTPTLLIWPSKKYIQQSKLIRPLICTNGSPCRHLPTYFWLSYEHTKVVDLHTATQLIWPFIFMYIHMYSVYLTFYNKMINNLCLHIFQPKKIVFYNRYIRLG